MTRARPGGSRRRLGLLALVALAGGPAVAPGAVSGGSGGKSVPRARAASAVDAPDAALERVRVTYRVALRAGARGFDRYLEARDAAPVDSERSRVIRQLSRAWAAVPLPADYRATYERDLARHLEAGGQLEPGVHARLASRPDLEQRAERLARLWSLHFALRELDTGELARAARAVGREPAAGPASSTADGATRPAIGGRHAGLR